MTDTTFDSDYLSTWTEPDPAKRREIIERLWVPDGDLVVSSLGITVTGVDAIAEHIAHVHDENIVGNGLTFSYDQHVDAADAALLRWSMTAPDGNVVARGADVVHRDDDGRVRKVYMFMGVD
jgi:hypothetical protein